MASSEMAREESEMEFDLAAVEQLTQQVTSFGFDTAEDPIFQWRLGIDLKTSQADTYSSDLFLINHSDAIGQLKFTRMTAEDKFQLSLIFTDSKKGHVRNSLHPFRLFLCKYKLYGDSDYEDPEKYRGEWFFPTNAFSADKNALNFEFDDHDASLIIVELYQEPLGMMQYRSPYENVVVGRLEEFGEIEEKTPYQKFMFASPRFSFSSPGQLMMVKFWYWHLVNTIGFSATLHIVSEGEPRGPPFSFAVIVTVFSQKETTKDLVHKVFFRRDENKSEYPMLLAFYREFRPFIEDDPLYYKVVIKPCPSE